jgi:GDP-L-fucose synthase
MLVRAYRRQNRSPFISAIAANPFGAHDDFNPESGHVIPGLIRRADEARRRREPTLTVWGTGKPRREFIAAQDLADACIFLMNHYDDSDPINIGTGVNLTIAEVAAAVASAVGYRGRLRFDSTKADGAPLKCLDSSPLSALGWRPSADFDSALSETYQWFLQHVIKEESAHGCAAV